jgi:hypothetical protein
MKISLKIVKALRQKFLPCVKTISMRKPPRTTAPCLIGSKQCEVQETCQPELFMACLLGALPEYLMKDCSLKLCQMLLLVQGTRIRSLYPHKGNIYYCFYKEELEFLYGPIIRIRLLMTLDSPQAQGILACHDVYKQTLLSSCHVALPIECAAHRGHLPCDRCTAMGGPCGPNKN